MPTSKDNEDRVAGFPFRSIMADQLNPFHFIILLGNIAKNNLPHLDFETRN